MQEMAYPSKTQNQPPAFVFGPYTLPTFPKGTNLSFRTKFPLPQDQQCLLDNLLNTRGKPQFIDILHALTGHLASLNARISDQPIHLTPQKPIGDMERTIQMLKISLKEKEKVLAQAIEEVKQLKIDQEAVQEEILSFVQKEEKKEEKEWVLFPEIIREVKPIIYRYVFRQETEEMNALQKIFREMIVTPHRIYSSSFRMIHFGGDENVSFKGFSFITLCIDLRGWSTIKIRGIEITLQKLYKYGFLSRIVIPEEWAEPILSDRVIDYVVKKGIKKKWDFNGYTNMQLLAIPPVYPSSYPDTVRTRIRVTWKKETSPVFIRAKNNPPPLPETDCPLSEQLVNYRMAMIASQEVNLGRMIYSNRVVKIYIPTSKTMNVPFFSLFRDKPRLEEYCRENCVYENTVTAYDPYDGDQNDDHREEYNEEGMDFAEEALHNLENMLEI